MNFTVAEGFLSDSVCLMLAAQCKYEESRHIGI